MTRNSSSMAYRTRLMGVLFGGALALACVSMTAAGQATPTLKQRPFVCDTTVNTPRKCASQLYDKVTVEFVQRHDMKATADGFRQVVQIDPTYGAAWFNLGVLAENERSWVEAKQDFEQYLAVAPTGPDVSRAKQELETLKPYLAGKVTAADARRIDYDNSVARARLLLDKSLFKEAIAEAGRAQSLDSSRWEAYAVVSLAMFRQHRTADGQKYAEMALQRTPATKKDEVAKALRPQP